MTLMNSFWEEVLWRGVYITLFPDSRWWGIVWPTVWFALWHYAPGSVSPLADVRMLMIGAGVLEPRSVGCLGRRSPFVQPRCRTSWGSGASAIVND